METRMDLGHGLTGYYVGWHPDRALNPQYEGIPDVERYCLVVDHQMPSGEPCNLAVTFDEPVARQVDPLKPKWTVEAWDPLTVSPSILCLRCGLHGFIRDGRWVAA